MKGRAMIGRAVRTRYTWDMRAEERFERIENELALIVLAQRGIVESQRIQAETLSQLMQTIGAYVESSDARMKRPRGQSGRPDSGHHRRTH
jgi:hypothetical protein